MGFGINGVMLTDFLEGYHKLANERDLISGFLEARTEILSGWEKRGEPPPQELLDDIERNRQELEDVKNQISAFVSGGMW